MFSPGDILLSKYRIETLIGAGAFAHVYRVTHLALNATRAQEAALAAGVATGGHSLRGN